MRAWSRCGLESDPEACVKPFPSIADGRKPEEIQTEGTLPGPVAGATGGGLTGGGIGVRTPPEVDTALPSNVTAPVRANNLPLTVAPVFTVMESCASMF